MMLWLRHCSKDSINPCSRSATCARVSARTVAGSMARLTSPRVSCSVSNAAHRGASVGSCCVLQRPLSGPQAMRKSFAARSSVSLMSGQSSASRACVMPSANKSLAKSITCEVVTCWPKNTLAISGTWCASSKITVLAAGNNSATPSSRNITSAKNKWWLTTTTSAACASLRACMTKQSL